VARSPSGRWLRYWTIALGWRPPAAFAATHTQTLTQAAETAAGERTEDDDRTTVTIPGGELGSEHRHEPQDPAVEVLLG